MNANFEYYKVFYYVSKYENLTKAASVLKTSQPAVTRTIHNLENILGCRLFTRSKSGMKLTPEGKIFYQYVAAGCAQFFKAEDNLNNLISLENGTIYISATETALHCYLFEAVRDFNIQYPNVHFKILNNSTTDSVNALKEGKVDLAVVSASLQLAEPLKMKVVRKYREILIGGSRFAELKGRIPCASRLLPEPEEPTTATISPAWIVTLKSLITGSSVCCILFWYWVKDIFMLLISRIFSLSILFSYSCALAGSSSLRRFSPVV